VRFTRRCNDQLVLRIVTGGYTSRSYVDTVHAAVSLFIIVVPNFLYSTSREFLTLRKYSRRVSRHGGTRPLSLPPSTSQASSFEEHTTEGHEEKKGGRREKNLLR
jgi:hypothetical protein